jgi:DNA uptake protein ComE-like DNA-binding protein
MACARALGFSRLWAPHSMSSLFRHKKTQQTLELISYHGEDNALMRSADGKLAYFYRGDLVEYDREAGVTNKPMVSPIKEEVDENEDRRSTGLPAETRLNVNFASPDQIADRIKGVGYSTAKKIVELRSTLPGERFSSLEQLRQVGRANWDEVFAEDSIFIG